MKATTKFGFEDTKFGFRIYTSKIINLISKNFIIMLIFILWSLVIRQLGLILFLYFQNMAQNN